MPSPFMQHLKQLGKTLPKGSSFRFRMGEGGVAHLAMLNIPKSQRGQGTPFVISILHLCDSHRVPVRLEADATDLPDDPTTLELVRWYRRFGFEIRSVTDEHTVMVREPRDPGQRADGLLRSYEAAKFEDPTLEEFEGLSDNQYRMAI